MPDIILQWAYQSGLLILPCLLYMYNGKGVLAFLVYSQMRLHHALPTQSMCGLTFIYFVCTVYIHWLLHTSASERVLLQVTQVLQMKIYNP